MTVINLYAVYDQKSETFYHPFPEKNHATAIRAFRTVVNDSSTAFYQYPADYALFHVAEFDLNTGSMNSQKPKEIAQAKELLNIPTVSSEE